MAKPSRDGRVDSMQAAVAYNLHTLSTSKYMFVSENRGVSSVFGVASDGRYRVLHPRTVVARRAGRTFDCLYVCDAMF